MRSLFKLSLAALLALLWAGSVYAVDVKFSGNVGAGFGQLTLGATGDNDGDGDKTSAGEDAGARTEFHTAYEANLRVTVGGGPLTAISRLRPRGFQSGSTTGSSTNSGGGNGSVTASTCDDAGTACTTKATTVNTGLSDIYNELWYKPTDTFTIGFGRFQGQAWSQPFSGGYVILHPLGSPEYWMNWTGIDGLDLEFNAGSMQIGLAIATECRPSCAAATASFATQTIVPHFNGKFGDIGVRASLPQTSAMVRTGSGSTEKDESVTGSGMQVGVSWAGMQGVYVGFDYQQFTDAGNDKASATFVEDQIRTGMGLRADFSGISFQYHDLKTVDAKGVKDAEAQSTYIKVSYTLKVGDGSIIPEVTTRTTTPAKDADAVSDMLIRLVGNVTY